METAGEMKERFAHRTLVSRFAAKLLAVLKSVKVQRRARLMRVCETLPLGERRFLAVIELEHRRFLIGATPQSIALLERLDDKDGAAHNGFEERLPL